MHCIHCDYPETHVVYTRPNDYDNKIKRRRECLRCGQRFTTYEKIREVLPNQDRKEHD